jgi:predicted CopG family antitoxin
MSEDEVDRYSLDELIERLVEIKRGESSALNFPKAFYSLCKEIEEIKRSLSMKEDMKSFLTGFSYRKPQ